MIRVLIVDDSLVVRNYLQFILSSDSEIDVIGTASDGETGVKLAEKYRPDVITMDINMPRMDGFAATRAIMQQTPTPIVVVSANYKSTEISKSFKAIEAGAVTIIEKPCGLTNPKHSEMAATLIDAVKQAATAKVFRRSKPVSISATPFATKPAFLPVHLFRYVAIGASTGGPLVLQEILSALPENFPVPILMVQHIATGFTEGMASWLSQKSPLRVVLAQDGVVPEAGTAYIAPDNRHMTLTRGGTLQLLNTPPEHSVRPSVSVLFRSLVQYHAKQTLAILLTGMGKDGALELKRLKDNGATTIAQDKASCIVFGMSGEAVKLGGATYVMNPTEIINQMKHLCMQK